MIYCTNKSSTTHTNTKGQLGFQKKKKKPKGFKGSPLHLSVDRTTFFWGRLHMQPRKMVHGTFFWMPTKG